MVFAYSFCNVPVMPVRAEPFHRAEQTTQLLFGEKAEVIEINEREWARIRCEYDGYEGWCKFSQLQVVSLKQYRKPNKFYSGKNSNRIIAGDREIWMPLGCNLFGIKELDIHGAKFKGKKINADDPECSKDLMEAYAKEFLDAPYQWGGRTSAGIDCSGLSQTVFKLCGIPILRDAAQQATQGETIDFLQHTHAGDLAFFDNAEGYINHVGILLNESTIIHATDAAGRVVIDRIDQGGIISTSLRKRTHNLRLVKRYF